MPKGWLCAGGGNGSERRVKSQRRVVNDLLVYLVCVCVAISLTEGKDHRQANKGVNDQLAPPQYMPMRYAP
jgi:hypothetical protein